MEKSGILNIIHHQHTTSLDRTSTDRSYSSSAPAMAATAVASPASMYPHPPGPPPPYSGSGWSAPASHPSSSLVSPPESRRPSENKSDPPPPPAQTAQPLRQSLPSLPSISEALGPKSGGPYVSPVSSSLPPHHHATYSQVHTSSIARSYPPPVSPSQSRQSPPQPVHSHSVPFSRPEHPSSFTEGPRQPPIASLQPVPAPSNPYDTRPRYDPPRFGQESQGPDRSTNGFNAPALQPQPHGPYLHGSSSNHPPGPHSPPYHPRYAPQDGRANIEPVKDRESAIWVHGLKRNLESWTFEDQLSAINIASGQIQTWSLNFHKIAQETTPIANLERMPSVEDCTVMLQTQDRIHVHLERLRDLIAQQNEYANMDHHRMREAAGKGSGFFDDEMSMYGDDMKNQAYGGPESKKRRGRAAPPGRCHSCNRAETPEWRRGPDGARTLCNACGLHYAKLTRKNTMKQQSNGSSLRPKAVDDLASRMG